MADYTIVNVKDVEDKAASFGVEDVEARFPTRELGLEKSALSYQSFGPGARLPFGHQHNEQEELYLIVSGSGRIKLDDEIVELKQWDMVRVPPQVMRGFEGGPEGAELIAFGAPNTGDPREDAEPVPGWWSD